MTDEPDSVLSMNDEGEVIETTTLTPDLTNYAFGLTSGPGAPTVMFCVRCWSVDPASTDIFYIAQVGNLANLLQQAAMHEMVCTGVVTLEHIQQVKLRMGITIDVVDE